MASEDKRCYAVSYTCPFCGEVSVGYRNPDGTVKAECRRCRTVTVKRIMGRRHKRVDIYSLNKERES